MEKLDIKEKVMLQHYEELFDKFLFDEYDILGFLMLIRRFVRNKYDAIVEFADLIAHRKRDRGKVMESISVAIESNYETYNGKKIKGYHGIDEQQWAVEWEGLFNDLDLKMNSRLLKEITICIFSLAQGSEYEDKTGKHHGYLMLIRGKNNTLSLSTTEGESNSLYICFSLLNDIEYNEKRTDFIYMNPVETVRIEGKLRLKDEKGYIM